MAFEEHKIILPPEMEDGIVLSKIDSDWFVFLKYFKKLVCLNP